MQVFHLSLTNMLLLVVTLGFGFAWVSMRSMRLFCNNVEFQGDPQLDALLQDDKSSPARGEGLLEALDVDIAL
jgi:uncharacterized membrane protein YjgN (DUF898 family)